MNEMLKVPEASIENISNIRNFLSQVIYKKDKIGTAVAELEEK